jgi:hypothetical protein
MLLVLGFLDRERAEADYPRKVLGPQTQNRKTHQGRVIHFDEVSRIGSGFAHPGVLTDGSLVVAGISETESEGRAGRLSAEDYFNNGRQVGSFHEI